MADEGVGGAHWKIAHQPPVDDLCEQNPDDDRELINGDQATAHVRRGDLRDVHRRET